MKALGSPTSAWPNSEAAGNRHRRLARPPGRPPVYKRIDTCAGEFASATPYMYSTYEGGYGDPVCEADPTDKQKIIILGGGPNRIGQGIEFELLLRPRRLRAARGRVRDHHGQLQSRHTDYDTSNRLYFEPLTAEDVIALVNASRTAAKCLVALSNMAARRRSSSARR